MKKLKEMSKKAKVFLLVCLIAVIGIPIFAFAEASPSASLEMKSEVKRGDVVQVKLNLNNVDEFAGAGFFIKYDSDHFDFDPDTGRANAEFRQYSSRRQVYPNRAISSWDRCRLVR